MKKGEEASYITSLCMHCRKHSKLRVLSKHGIPAIWELNKPDTPLLGKNGKPMGYITTYFCLCEGCLKVLLVEEPPWDSTEKNVVFPVDKRFINVNLPKLVKKSYYEAVGCEKCNLTLATIVMVGRTIESIIKEFSPNQKNIFEGLKELKAQEIISHDIFSWGSELRSLRNIGAHAVDENIEMVDAQEAMDFLQAIIDIIYVLRPKFQKMKKRRKKLDV